jgi:hypothetical protein
MVAYRSIWSWLSRKWKIRPLILAAPNLESPELFCFLRGKPLIALSFSLSQP